MLAYIFAQQKIVLWTRGQEGTGLVTGMSNGGYSINIVDPPGIQTGFRVGFGSGKSAAVGSTDVVYKASDTVPILFANVKGGIVGEIKTKADLRRELQQDFIMFVGFVVILLLVAVNIFQQKKSSRTKK